MPVQWWAAKDKASQSPPLNSEPEGGPSSGGGVAQWGGGMMYQVIYQVTLRLAGAPGTRVGKGGGRTAQDTAEWKERLEEEKMKE